MLPLSSRVACLTNHKFKLVLISCNQVKQDAEFLCELQQLSKKILLLCTKFAQWVIDFFLKPQIIAITEFQELDSGLDFRDLTN